MSSDSLMVEGISPTAVHEAAHAVVHLKEYGTFRYMTLRPRLKGVAGHVYGLGTHVSPTMLLAGPLAQMIYTGEVDEKIQSGAAALHMYQHGGCSDLDAYFKRVAEEDMDLWVKKTVERLDKHWEPITLIAGLLERRRTLTLRQVRDVLDAIEKGLV